MGPLSGITPPPLPTTAGRSSNPAPPWQQRLCECVPPHARPQPRDWRLVEGALWRSAAAANLFGMICTVLLYVFLTKIGE